MGKWHRSTYDDDCLVDEIAKGELSYAQIAEQTGLSKDHVGRIARGEFRPELYERILSARRAFLERARDLCIRLAWPAMRRLGTLIASPDVPAEVQRRAAMDILSMPLGAPTDAEASGGARLVRVECADSVVVLPADMFIEAEEETTYEGDPVPWRTGSTRAEYLRVVAARVEPGAPKLLSRPEDIETITDILRAEGKSFPGSALSDYAPTLPGFPPFAQRQIRRR